MKAVSSFIREMDSSSIDTFLENGQVSLTLEGETIELNLEDIEISSEGISGWLVGQEEGITVALDTKLSDELIAEGLARETVNRIQNMRKEAGFSVTDRIHVSFSGSEIIVTALKLHADWIRNETLSVELEEAHVLGGDITSEFEINNEQLTIGIRRLGSKS